MSRASKTIPTKRQLSSHQLSVGESTGSLHKHPLVCALTVTMQHLPRASQPPQAMGAE